MCVCVCVCVCVTAWPEKLRITQFHTYKQYETLCLVRACANVTYICAFFT